MYVHASTGGGGGGEFFQRAKELADVFFRFIYDEHVTYGLRLAALGLPAQTDEVAQRPNLSFLEAAREANMIFHLCESKYTEILAPALKSAPGGASPQLAQVRLAWWWGWGRECVPTPTSAFIYSEGA